MPRRPSENRLRPATALFLTILLLPLAFVPAWAGDEPNDRWVAGYSSPGFPGPNAGGIVSEWNSNGFLWIPSLGGCIQVPGPSGTTVPAPIWIWDGSHWDYEGTGCLNSSNVFAVEQRGTNVYLGGNFMNVDGLPIQYLVRWDGQNWSAPWEDDMGAPAQPDGPVFSLAYDGTQHMYVGGSFGNAGTVSLSNVGRLDGFRWEPLEDVGGLAEGTNGTVTEIEIGNEIIVAGDFSIAGGEMSVNNIAKWMPMQNDGSWSKLGEGINWPPGIDFLSVGNAQAWVSFAGTDPGIPASRIAYFDLPNGPWTSPGDFTLMPGIGVVQAEVSGGNRVLARGDFSDFGDPGTERLGEWVPIPGTWQQPPNMDDAYDTTALPNSWGLIAQTNDFFYFDNRITPAEEELPVFTSGITRFDGLNWHGLGQGFGTEGVTAHFVSAIAEHGGEIFVGGAFPNAGDARLLGLARWQAGDWVAAGDPLSAAGPVEDFAVYDFATYQGDLVMGGCFKDSGATTLDGVGRWNGSAWVPIGSGFDSLQFTCNPSQAWHLHDGVHKLLPDGTDLYAGGSIFEGSGLNGIARWNGVSWNAVGGGATGGIVFDLAKIGSNLYVGGTITTVDNSSIPVNRIAMWNGATWDDLGGGVDNGDPTVEGVYALATMGSDLYAAGSFTTAGGISANNIARWDGAAWHPLGSGLNERALDMEVIGGELYVTGLFTEAGGEMAMGIAKWDGAAWSATEFGYGLTLNGSGGFGRDLQFVATTTAEGDPSGNLYVGGYFNFAGDKLSSNFGIYQLGEIIDVIFQDGFESGNTSNWSNTVP